MDSSLTVAINQIEVAAVDTSRKVELQVAAVKEFMAGHSSPAKTSACDDLERFYKILSSAAGSKISRPSRASAFLKCLDLKDFSSRMSKLSSRRRLEAHPDSGFLTELESVLSSLDRGRILLAADRFRISSHGSGSTCSAGESSVFESSSGLPSGVASGDVQARPCAVDAVHSTPWCHDSTWFGWSCGVCGAYVAAAIHTGGTDVAIWSETHDGSETNELLAEVAVDLDSEWQDSEMLDTRGLSKSDNAESCISEITPDASLPQRLAVDEEVDVDEDETVRREESLTEPRPPSDSSTEINNLAIEVTTNHFTSCSQRPPDTVRRVTPPPPPPPPPGWAKWSEEQAQRDDLKGDVVIPAPVEEKLVCGIHNTHASYVPKPPVWKPSEEDNAPPLLKLAQEALEAGDTASMLCLIEKAYTVRMGDNPS